MSKISTIICWVLALLFLLFAVVQFNDPDPMVWITVYFGFALMALSVIYFRLPGYVYLLLGAMTGIWAFFQWPDTWEGIGESMLNENMERAREALGLVICSAAGVIYFALGTGKEDKVKQIDNFRS